MIFCTETQISKNETADIRLSGFNVLENNAEHKYSSMAMYAKEGIEIEEIFSTGWYFVSSSTRH